MDELSNGLVPPGWYSDPYGRAIQRYFNGSTWTPYVVDASGNQQVDDPTRAPQPAAPAAHAGQGAIVIQNIVGAQPQYQPGIAYPAGIGAPKSPGLAVLLAFLFGPLGLLYVNVLAAIVMTVISVLLFFTIIIPIGIWVASMIYAHSEATKINRRALAATLAPQPIYGAVQPPMAWNPQASHHNALPPPPVPPQGPNSPGDPYQ